MMLDLCLYQIFGENQIRPFPQMSIAAGCVSKVGMRGPDMALLVS